MTLDYFYGQAGELFSFFRIPKALFQEQRFQDLSTDAKTLYGILLTMTDSRTNYGQQIDNLIRGAYGSKIKMFDQTIPRSVRAAEISAVSKSIFQHDPKGKVAEAYQSLTKEVLADAERQLKRVAERGR